MFRLWISATLNFKVCTDSLSITLETGVGELLFLQMERRDSSSSTVSIHEDNFSNGSISVRHKWSAYIDTNSVENQLIAWGPLGEMLSIGSCHWWIGAVWSTTRNLFSPTRRTKCHLRIKLLQNFFLVFPSFVKFSNFPSLRFKRFPLRESPFVSFFGVLNQNFWFIKNRRSELQIERSAI